MLKSEKLEQFVFLLVVIIAFAVGVLVLVVVVVVIAVGVLVDAAVVVVNCSVVVVVFENGISNFGCISFFSRNGFKLSGNCLLRRIRHFPE